MAHYLIPPNGKPASIAPSLARKERGVGTLNPSANGTNGVQQTPYPYHTEPEPGNPTIVPEQLLKKFHFTFLIRHPRSSIPSYYRCTIPPLDEVTGFYDFVPSEAGYAELRQLFDHLRSTGYFETHIAGQDDKLAATNGLSTAKNNEMNGSSDKIDICVVDADDLLDNPNGIIETFCKSVGVEYDPKMLDWNSEEDHQLAKHAFKKWPGFHDDAIKSSALKPRLHVSLYPAVPVCMSCRADICCCKKKKVKTSHDEDDEWVEKFGEKGAKAIRDTVDANVRDYEYLKQFAIKAT